MQLNPITKGGRLFSAEDFAYAQKLVRQLSSFSLREIAETLCEHWHWYTASGGYKAHACEALLRELEVRQLLSLPASRSFVRKVRPSRVEIPEIPRTCHITCELQELGCVRLALASDQEQKALFNEYVQRHHYLGYKRPFGNVLRYFIMARGHVLGCILIAGGAKAIAVRDRWIGWDKERRISNLPWVINNTRFLIFPWVSVPHLASHILGKLVKQVRQDCLANWNYAPLLLETFVDPVHYRGTCYKASNWVYLGETTGRGHYRSGQSYQTRPKMIFVYPLTPMAKEHLSTLNLMSTLERTDDET